MGRLPLVILGIASLLCGVWGGLIRLPFNLPLPSDNANWITFHGPLMVCGFLGTVIGLERAVGMPQPWTYLAPVLTGAGAITLILGSLGSTGPLLMTLGSALFFVVTLQVVKMQRALFTGTMSVGALTWMIGNGLWLSGWPFQRVVPWWMGFLALTILGERLDLSRFQKPHPSARPLLVGALGLFLAGMSSSLASPRWGERLTGLGLVALASWLARFDIARRTVRQPGLPRFMAICLLSGYGWMAAAGALMMVSAPLEAGVRYDAVLHSFFLGFVFAMIFGHAPVIFPSVLQVPVSFHGRFYAHVVLLHASLLLRVASDLTEWPLGRQWGGAANAVALAVFLINTISSLVLGNKR